MSIRHIEHQSTARPTLEGAGVHLHRAFGFGDTAQTDPFLLFDDFRNDDPAAYAKGFPWHPHRGIETITYVLAGTVEHGDSLGNRGELGPGSVQWMTAGRGILHQEMPKGDSAGRMHGFQLWANLPSSEKMTAPRYQDITGDDIPTVVEDDGSAARVICGEFWGARGPVDGVAAEPMYLDISLPPGVKKVLPVPTWRQAFAYVFAGDVSFRDASQPLGVLHETVNADGEEVISREAAGNRSLVLFSSGDAIHAQAGPEGARFLLCSGRPIEEPVAWHGPIVMNTQDEIRTALQELQNGQFIR